MTTDDPALLVDLAAFVDGQHYFRRGGKQPQSGVDCWEWCPACGLLARIPADVRDEARRRERGVERD